MTCKEHCVLVATGKNVYTCEKCGAVYHDVFGSMNQEKDFRIYGHIDARKKDKWTKPQ